MTFMDMTPMTRRQRIRAPLRWHYIRQTRLFLPFTDWWLNRGNP